MLPIGFETEWIRPRTLELVKNLQKKYQFDMFVGSVHHVHTIPIDFDKPMYESARTLSGGSDERLFEDYFDSQYEMLQALKPPVVGHFDLIRLFSKDPNGSFQGWDGVWSRITRNLQFVADYKGLLELNSSALRKGMAEPYPKVEICKVSVLGFVQYYLRSNKNTDVLKNGWRIRAFGRLSFCRASWLKLPSSFRGPNRGWHYDVVLLPASG